jgi:hypothetical protein
MQATDDDPELFMLRGKVERVCLRLGGKVEGKPTHEGNYLQRIDELLRVEKAAKKLARGPRVGPVGP